MTGDIWTKKIRHYGGRVVRTAADIVPDRTGTGLAETAMVLPLYVIILCAVIEFHDFQEHMFCAHTAARAAAWTVRHQGSLLAELLDAVKDGTLELDDMMDTNCGRYRARHDSTTILVPRLTVDVGYAVDKNTWKLDLSLRGIIQSFRKAFGGDEMSDKYL
jgi:hypothetical protein